MARVQTTETVYLSKEENAVLVKAGGILRQLFVDASNGGQLESKIEIVRDNLTDLLDIAVIEY